MKKTGQAAVLLTVIFLLAAAFSAAACADVIISEVMASNGFYENGHAYDWIELHNDGKQTVDLSGWYLSDSKKDPKKWSFPKGAKLKAGAYLTVFCTGEDGISPGKGDTFYTGYSISASGETLILSDADGTELQRLKVPQQYGCVSWGRPAGGGTYGFFENPTRGKKNDAAAYPARTEKPVLVETGGFYTDRVTVHASGPEGAVLRYTTDGETPTAKSKVFPAEGLTLKETTPLRVKAFREGEVTSETESATYLVNDDPQTPVVCLISDDKYLFSRKTGMLVKGTGSIPNYSKGYEYPVHIEYFNMDGEREISQTGTMT